MVVGRAIVSDLYKGQEAAKAMTVLVMMLTIGPIVSPTLGSLLLMWFGWRSIFVVMMLFGVLAFGLAFAIVPETLAKPDRTERPLQAGAIAMGRLFSDRGFLVSALVAAFVQGGMFAFITGSSAVFQGVFGFTSLQFGLIFAAIATALLIFGQINKRLLTHYRPDTILRVGLHFYLCAALGLVGASIVGSLWLFVALLWASIGMVGLLSANAMALAMEAGAAGGGRKIRNAGRHPVQCRLCDFHRRCACGRSIGTASRLGNLSVRNDRFHAECRVWTEEVVRCRSRLKDQAAAQTAMRAA